MASLPVSDRDPERGRSQREPLQSLPPRGCSGPAHSDPLRLQPRSHAALPPAPRARRRLQLRAGGYAMERPGFATSQFGRTVRRTLGAGQRVRRAAVFLAAAGLVGPAVLTLSGASAAGDPASGRPALTPGARLVTLEWVGDIALSSGR